MKLCTDNHHVSGRCWKDLQAMGTRSRSRSNGHENPVNLIAPEPLKEFEQQLTPNTKSEDELIRFSRRWVKRSRSRKRKHNDRRFAVENHLVCL